MSSPAQRINWKPFQSRYGQPFAHQITTTKFLLSNKRAYVFNDLGTGKTLSALWALDILIHHSKIESALIVCPLSTIHAVWEHEIFRSFPQLSYTVLHGSKQKRLERLAESHHLYLINVDGVKVIEQELIDKNFDLVLFDELTAFKNARSDRSKAAQRITKEIKAVWGMTGAPVTESPLDAFGQGKLINPECEFLPKYYTHWRNLTMIRQDEWTWVPKTDWRDAVSAVLQPAIRYELRDCVDIPETIHQYRETPLKPEVAQIYKDLEKEYITYLKDATVTAMNAGAHYMRLLQVSSGVVRDETGAWHRLDISAKVQALTEILETTSTHRIVVGVYFRHAIQFLREELLKRGYSCAFIDSSVAAKERAHIIRRFDEGKLQFLIAQPGTLQFGVDLTASNVLVWFSPVSSGEIFMQFRQRIVRASQKLAQNIIMLYSTTKERKVYRALATKQRIHETLMQVYR